MANSIFAHSLGFPAARVSKAQKLLFFINGALLTFIGTVAALGDLVAYQTGKGPLGERLFNAPYAVSFFKLHGLTAFFGILLLTMARRDLKPAWHIAAAHGVLYMLVRRSDGQN